MTDKGAKILWDDIIGAHEPTTPRIARRAFTAEEMSAYEQGRSYERTQATKPVVEHLGSTEILLRFAQRSTALWKNLIEERFADPAWWENLHRLTEETITKAVDAEYARVAKLVCETCDYCHTGAEVTDRGDWFATFDGCWHADCRSTAESAQ